ncbi:hypothetical protein Tco_1391908 [Tanacetum coccineum]
MPPKRNGMSAAAIEQLINQRVADALLTHEANRNKDNGNGSHDLGGGNRRSLHNVRGCTYKEFLNCQPLNFKGTKGAVGLAYWFENMEFVFHIGFPAQSIRSSNTDVLDLPCLLVLIIGTSQSRQHSKSESDSYYLSD